MDLTLLGAIIGVGGTIVGTGLGSFIQWRFNKIQNKKETKRILIELKAKIFRQMFAISRAGMLLRRCSYKYYYLMRTHNLIKSRELKRQWNEYDSQEADLVKEKLDNFKQDYFNIVSDCYEPIASFITHTNNNRINQLFKEIYNLDKDKYLSIALTLELDDYLEINLFDEIEKASSKAKAELESYFRPLRIEIDKEIKKYS